MNSTTPHTIRPGDNLYHLAQVYHTTVASILARNENLDPHNLTIGRTIDINANDFSIEPNDMPPQTMTPTLNISQLQLDMRTAWSQHVFWTRLLLVSIAARLDDEAATTARLLENPGNIASIFAPYFDAAMVGDVEQLLTQHLQIGAQLITALRDKQNNQAAQLSTQWYENADQLAAALHAMNPRYNLEELKTMMRTHLDLTTKEVAARLAARYEDDIAAMDEVEREAMMMADFKKSRSTPCPAIIIHILCDVVKYCFFATFTAQKNISKVKDFRY
ncbi:MAG: LysM domain-containing protein [Oscillospiraceae bacterium]|nr:LysM domain-containing protein [Oscillospiraceae bacterium]